MKKRLYFLAYQGENLAASFDAFEGNLQLDTLLEICKTSGYLVKEVSESEYEKEKEIAEEKDLKELYK